MTAQFMRRTDEFTVHFINRNAAGGRAYFLPSYNPQMLQAIMKEAVPTWDVAIAEPMAPVKTVHEYEGSLTYIHKVKDGRNIYLFANSTDHPIDTTVALRGNLKLEVWDPMNGKIRSTETTSSKTEAGVELTSVPLKLDPVSAMFLVEQSQRQQ
jgi:hypothetical protein